MKHLTLPILLLLLLLSGCASVNRQFAEAVEGDRQTVGAEWWAEVNAKHDAGEMSDEDFARRERKWFSMGYRNATALDKELNEPGAPSEKDLAEATQADLVLLGGE